MNRTRGFVNQNRFKSGKAIKRQTKAVPDRYQGGKLRRSKQVVTPSG